MKSGVAPTQTTAKRSTRRIDPLPASSGIALSWMNQELQQLMKDDGGYLHPSERDRSRRQEQEAGLATKCAPITVILFFTAVCRLPSAPPSCSCLPLLIGCDEIRVPLFQVLITYSPTTHHHRVRQLERAQVHVGSRVFKPAHALISSRLILFNYWLACGLEISKRSSDTLGRCKTFEECYGVFECELRARPN